MLRLVPTRVDQHKTGRIMVSSSMIISRPFYIKRLPSSIDFLIVHLVTRPATVTLPFQFLPLFKSFDNAQKSQSIMHFINTLLSFLGGASVANVSGSNCRDRGVCAGIDTSLSSVIAQLKGMDQHQRFSDGQHITCVDTNSKGSSSLCLSYQGTGRSWTVFQTAWFAQSLMEKGCQACGSLPLGSDHKHGELTSSVTTKPAGGL